MITSLLFLFSIAVGYLVGSINSAIIVSRLFDLPDPRKEGSQNPGATNVLRLAGREYAAVVLFADMLKGFLPVMLAIAFKAGPETIGFTCFAAVLGHMYPVFFKFEGGKGIATAMGALLALNFLLGVIVIVTWLIIANLTRYSSAASIISMLLAPLYSLFAFGNTSVFLPIMCISFATLYRHRDNITRLMDGTESKFYFKSQSSVAKTKGNKSQPILKAVKATTKSASKTVKKTSTKTKKEAPKKAKTTVKAKKAVSKPAEKTSKAETPKKKTTQSKKSAPKKTD